MNIIMKKILFLLILGISCSNIVLSQAAYFQIDKLKSELQNTREDSVKCRLISAIASGFRFSNFDSSRFYADSCVRLANKAGNEKLKSTALSMKGFTLLFSGRLPESLQCQYDALKISEQIRDTFGIALALNRIGNVYMELGEYRKSIEHYLLSQNLYRLIGKSGRYYNASSNIGNVYNLMNKPDSALFFLTKAYTASLKTTDRIDFTRPEMMFRIGTAYKLKADTANAIQSYRMGIVEANKDHDLVNLSMCHLLLAKIYDENHLTDSSVRFATSALRTSKVLGFEKCILEAASLLSEIYNRGKKYDSAYKYLKISIVAQESITSRKRIIEWQKTILNELEEKRSTADAVVKKENRQKQIVLISGLIIVVVIAIFLYRNSNQQKKVNTVLKNQKEEIEITLAQLKSTQSQLIQSEKMASLGELTAGIAHEIQNPLNFVNNFSELNVELLEELQTEMRPLLAEGEVGVTALIDDIKSNSEKINHHGQRAAAIVKGMLQHSRTSSGQKEPTDINALCDEYLRLAYHGLRAKDKSFNAEFKTEFDETIPKVNIVPQDMGRVVLNLINNAFFAVGERGKEEAISHKVEAISSEEKGIPSGLQLTPYSPTVTVSTKNLGNKIEITVSDNGTGIPSEIKEKIFQPFFTTKPTGQGTGLGLSLAYDIVTKVHGGKLTVESEQGKGTTFKIEIPT